MIELTGCVLHYEAAVTAVRVETDLPGGTRVSSALVYICTTEYTLTQSSTITTIQSTVRSVHILFKHHCNSTRSVTVSVLCRTCHKCLEQSAGSARLI